MNKFLLLKSLMVIALSCLSLQGMQGNLNPPLDAPQKKISLIDILTQMKKNITVEEKKYLVVQLSHISNEEFKDKTNQDFITKISNEEYENIFDNILESGISLPDSSIQEIWESYGYQLSESSPILPNAESLFMKYIQTNILTDAMIPDEMIDYCKKIYMKFIEGIKGLDNSNKSEVFNQLTYIVFHLNDSEYQKNKSISNINNSYFSYLLDNDKDLILKRDIKELIFNKILPKASLNTDIKIKIEDLFGSIIFIYSLQENLEAEKNDKGSFIRSIISDLKECSNQKLLAINYLTIKSAYWWDMKPKSRTFDETSDKNIQTYKDFIIDRKYRSSVYDREGYHRNINLASNLSKISNNSFYGELVNSWKSTSEKIKFLYDKDIGQPKGNILNILDYGYETKQHLDTYPSVYQIMKATKWLKYDRSNAHPTCPLNMKVIEEMSPSKIMIGALDRLFQRPFYQKFSQQNHPLNRIIQDHLKKLYYMAIKSSDISSIHHGVFAHNPVGVEENGTSYNRSLLFHKVLNNIEKMIQYMSIFNIDMDRGLCEINEIKVNNMLQDPYYLYFQFYEIINDLLFLLMYTEAPYAEKDFNTIISQTYMNRIPVLQTMKEKGISIDTFAMRSGMDAFVNSAMAINYMPQDISIAPKVMGLENSIYYEIDILITKFNEKRKNLTTYMSLNRKLNENDFYTIKDSFIISYLYNILDIKADYGDDKNLENSDNIYKFVKTFKKNPFKDYYHKRLNYYYEAKSKFDIPETAKESVAKLFLDELKKENFYNQMNLFEEKEYNGKYFLKINEIFYDKLDSKAVKLQNDFFNKDEDILIIDDHPSILSGMTTDTIDLSHDTKYVERLFNKIKTIYTIKMAQSKGPFIILWDTTLEIKQGPCYKMIEKFQSEIENGKMVVILFKSLQKYANLGIGKMKAGATTIIGQEALIKPIRLKLQEYATDVWNHHAKEFMLMTFYFDRFKNDTGFQAIDGLHDNEAFYFDAVSKQAKKIYEANLNQYQISGGCLFSNGGLAGIPYADTFGFAIPTSTIINYGSRYRYSVGLNPKGLR